MITAMISKKGGVGKTTTTVNLAGALARTGQRVLLVDLDSQASASRSLGVPRSKLAPSIADVLFWGTPTREAVRSTEVENLDLITASADLVSADIDLGQSRQRETRLRSALDPLRDSYDAILLDCSPSLSLLPINALTAADAFIAPVVPHFLAIEGVESLLKAAQRVRAYFNRDLECLGILMTMVDYRTNETRANVERIRQQYGRMVFGVEIRINTRLAEAPGRGKTIFDYDPEATGAAAHSLLAVEYALRSRALRRLADGDESIADTAAVQESSTTEPSEENATEPSEDQRADISAETATAPSTENSTEPSEDQRVDISAESAMAPSAENGAEPSEDQRAEISAESATEPSTEYATEPSEDQRADISTESATAPAAESTAGPSEDQRADNSAEGATAPSTEGATGPSGIDRKGTEAESAAGPSAGEPTELSAVETPEPSVDDQTRTTLAELRESAEG